MAAGAVMAPASAAETSSGLSVSLTEVTAAHEGSIVTYQAVVRNDGVEPTTLARLYFDTPDGFGIAMQYDAQLCWRYESQDLDCEVLPLAPGEELVYSFEYLVRAAPGDYTMTATLDPRQNPVATREATVVTSVAPSSELQVSWYQFRSGGDVVRRATVISYGPSPAEDVTLSLSWGGTWAAAQPSSITTSQGSCEAVGGASAECSLGTIEPYGTVTVDLVFRGRASRGLTTTAVVSSSTFDQDLSTNTAVLR
jgi:hypothetical protein